jgi:hypothetical protein
MKAYELPAKVTPEGKLDLTSVILEELLPSQRVRVIILVEEATDTSETPSNAYIETTETGNKLLPEVTDRRQQLELLKHITERMQQNPLPLEASPLTREELHERG